MRAKALRALFAGTALCAALSACGSASGRTGVALEATHSGREASQGPVTISPLPGTPDASPTTQISFLGPDHTVISDVKVSGSASGRHSGHLEPYSTETGESFLVSKPFRAGERVTVHAEAVFATGSENISDTFTIAHQAPVAQAEFPINKGDPHAVQHYISAPSITPSTVKIITPEQPGASPGDFFLDPYQGTGRPGPMIVDGHGSLIWFHPLGPEESSTNFQVQQYEGKPVLTWWQGRILELGFGQGEDEIYNSSYQHVATIRAGNGYKADLHEIRITPQGTAWIDAFDPIEMNLSSAHGVSHGVLSDSVIQEIDIKTGLVMWEWHALGHIPLSESNTSAPSSNDPWDYVHINTADPGANDDLLLSSRNTWTIYDVNLTNGQIKWRLGGKHSSFKLGAGVRFYWQHDTEWQPGGLISVFDNGSTPPKEKQSRGLILEPNYSKHTVRLIKAFTNPTKTLLASSQGNLLNLSPGATHGNWLMGYGGLPNFTEYNSAGKVLFDATLGKNVQDFRTYLSPWTAAPTYPPTIGLRSKAGTVGVYASWNGATEVASWRLLSGPSPTSLTPLLTAPRTGFETNVGSVPSTGAYVQVQALGSSGQVLASSPAEQAG